MNDVLKYLPHRYPFIMIDKITSIDVNERKIKCIKNVSHNEHWVPGHMPNTPIFPGTLMLEAFSQSCIILNYAIANTEYKLGDEIFAVNFKEFACKKMVLPGDTIVIETSISSIINGLNLVTFSSVAKVDNQIAAILKSATGYMKFNR